GGGLRVGDIAGDVLQRIRLRTQPGHRGSKSIEDTHDITLPKSGQPDADTRAGSHSSGPCVANGAPRQKLRSFNTLMTRRHGSCPAVCARPRQDLPRRFLLAPVALTKVRASKNVGPAHAL